MPGWKKSKAPGGEFIRAYEKYRRAKKNAQAADRLLSGAERRAKAAHETLRKAGEAVKQEFRAAQLRDIV